VAKEAKEAQKRAAEDAKLVEKQRKEDERQKSEQTQRRISGFFTTVVRKEPAPIVEGTFICV
jgi:hypothetical protein